MAFFIKPPVTQALVFSAFSGRNRRLAAAVIDIINELIAVIPAVSQDAAVFHIDMFQDRDRIVDIIPLSFTDHYVNGIAVCIHGSMYLCTGTAAAVPDFVRESHFFRHLRCDGVPGQ